MIPDDIRIGRLVPGPWLNAVLVGTTLVDAGVRWSWGPLSRFLSGQVVTEHLVSHAHGDHTGASARLCTTHRIPLLMGRRDAEAFTAGRIDTHGWAAVRL
ncbi:MAG: MBL fold metallo-hydrolase, partial [Actinomycetes bacterium]